MNKIATALRKSGAFLLVPILLITFFPTTVADAQGGQISTGVIIGVEIDPTGGLSAFTISNENGELLRFGVSAETQFGLEDQVGDRWTAILSEAPQEAARRLERHLADFAPVTVISGISAQVAETVTEAEPRNLETNLGWIGATFGVTWAGFFAYFLWMSKRQTDLQIEIKRLKLEMATLETSDKKQ